MGGIIFLVREREQNLEPLHLHIEKPYFFTRVRPILARGKGVYNEKESLQLCE